jgi:hypothetical protein
MVMEVMNANTKLIYHACQNISVGEILLTASLYSIFALYPSRRRNARGIREYRRVLTKDALGAQDAISEWVNNLAYSAGEAFEFGRGRFNTATISCSRWRLVDHTTLHCRSSRLNVGGRVGQGLRDADYPSDYNQSMRHVVASPYCTLNGEHVSSVLQG